MRKLTVDDILDLRAYERVREQARRDVIALKKKRRVHVGELVTIVFENTDTMRFQIQEMARAEKMLRDEQIAHEVATYNALIPGEGELSCTLFIELDGEAKLLEWLPRLVGIHESVKFALPGGREVRGYDPEADRLSREDVTAAVHFLKFEFSADEQRAFADGPVTLGIDHPAYTVSVALTSDQHAELAADLAADLRP